MVYTFDIFDTLITRTTAQPEGIFMIMQEMLDRDDRFTKLPSHFKRHFRDFRMDAESEAHRRAANMGREDVTLEMIYAQMAYMNYLPRETVQWLMELELAAEAENSIPIPDNINRLKSLKEENEIYLLSDMYLPGEHIRQMLVAADGVFRDIPILVSGEIGKNKSSGKLYAYFLEKYGIDSRKWVHIGDNPKSDGVMAVRAGGRSELYSGYGFTEFERRLLKEQGNQYAVQFTLGMVRKVKGDKRESTRAEQVGMSVGGPVLFGYVLWVLQEALRQGIQTLFFVARDGYLLKKMADLIIRSRKMALQTRYLYGSRYVWRIAAGCRSRQGQVQGLGAEIRFVLNPCRAGGRTASGGRGAGRLFPQIAAGRRKSVICQGKASDQGNSENRGIAFPDSGFEAVKGQGRGCGIFASGACLCGGQGGICGAKRNRAFPMLYAGPDSRLLQRTGDQFFLCNDKCR